MDYLWNVGTDKLTGQDLMEPMGVNNVRITPESMFFPDTNSGGDESNCSYLNRTEAYNDHSMIARLRSLGHVFDYKRYISIFYDGRITIIRTCI